MAVKQLDDQISSSENQNVDINTILTLIHNYRQENGFNRINLTELYERFVFLLSQVKVPTLAPDLKEFKEQINIVSEFMSSVVENEPNSEILLLTCLNTLYRVITTDQHEASSAVSIVLDLFEESVIPSTVVYILNSTEVTVKKIFTVLVKWSYTTNFAKRIKFWIIGLLNGLRDRQKYELLQIMTYDTIDHLFVSLLLKHIRITTAPIVFYILQSIQHTDVIFHKIIPRVPNILRALKREMQQNNVENEQKIIIQEIVDTISALIDIFPDNNRLYTETQFVLREFQISSNYNYLLEGKSWIDYSVLLRNNTNARVGLVNLGNTCYMNSVLQALVMTKQFSREILLSESKAPLLIKIQQLLALLLHSTRPELTPREVLLAARPPGFIAGHQQDSSEFLGYLLETLHEQEKQVNKNKVQFGQKTVSVDSGLMEFNKYFDTKAKNEVEVAASIQQINSTGNTLIQTTFSGQTTITHKCLNCAFLSTNTDYFRDLQLSFPEIKNDQTNYSVQNLLDYYCQPEKLDGDNQYSCDECKNLSDGERYIHIITAPKNLILTLKHFKYDQNYHTRAKLMHKIHLDETISLNLVQSETEKSVVVKYVLYAAVVHSGTSMDSGHYYTYAADTPSRWYKFNDNYVTECSINDLHNLSSPNTPYILFYQMNSQNSNGAAACSMSDSDVDESLMKKPCLNENMSTINNKLSCLPALEELPVHLRDLVNKDKNSYIEEIRNLQQKRQKPCPSTIRKDYKDSDNDDSCGGNNFNDFNRYIC